MVKNGTINFYIGFLTSVYEEKMQYKYFIVPFFSGIYRVSCVNACTDVGLAIAYMLINITN